MRTFPVYRISLGLIVARLRNVAGSSVISPSPSASPWQNGFAERSRPPVVDTYGLKPSATSTAIVAERRQARGSSRPCLQWCRLAQNSGRCGSRRGPNRLPSLTFHELRASLLVGNYPYKRHRARQAHRNLPPLTRSMCVYSVTKPNESEDSSASTEIGVYTDLDEERAPLELLFEIFD